MSTILGFHLHMFYKSGNKGIGRLSERKESVHDVKPRNDQASPSNVKPMHDQASPSNVKFRHNQSMPSNVTL